MGGVRLVDGLLIVVYCDYSSSGGWDASTWDVQAGEKLWRKPLSGDLSIFYPTPGTFHPTPYDDLTVLGAAPDCYLGISEDGTTFFAVNPEEIRTWSILTGESTGSLIHRDYTCASTPLSVNSDGPIIWIRSLGGSRARGWDLMNLGSSPLDPSNIPDRLRLACLQGEGLVWGGTDSSRIIDTTSQTEVFRLPEQYRRYGKAVWDGRYFFAAYETGDFLILDFVHMTLR